MILHSLLIPVAAFAVTVTGAAAFSPDVLKNAGLSETQIEAFVEARELVEAGDREGAREVLVDAGIDMSIMNRIRTAWHEFRAEHRSEIMAAVEANDYEAFKEAIEGSPLADIINTEAEFDQFVEAHAYIEAGDREAAHEIFEGLGLARHHEGNGNHKLFSSLSAEQRTELEAAFEDRDKDRVREILNDAGIDLSGEGKGFGLGLINKIKLNTETDN